MSFSYGDYEIHLFDLDDTLINTTHAFRNACTRTITDIFPEQARPDEYLEKILFFSKLFGSGQFDLFWSAFLKEINFKIKGLSLDTETVAKNFENTYFAELQTFDGASEYLSTLKNENKKIGIISNGNYERQVRKLTRVRLMKYFSLENVFVSSNFKENQKKPSDKMITDWLDKFQADKTKTVFYGDRTEDIVSGNLCGITTVQMTMVKRKYESNLNLCVPYFFFNSWQDVTNNNDINN